MRDFLHGVGYPFRALGAINRHPELWRFVLVPILINLVVGLLLYVGLLAAGFAWIDTVIAELPEWLGVLAVLLRILLVIGLLISTGYILVRFGVVLGSPFYGQLSEKLEEQLLGRAPPAAPLSAAGIARDIGRALLYELKKLMLVLAIGLPLLLLNVIPGVGQILIVAGQIALGATITCLDFLDSPLERRRLRFRDKLGVVRRLFPTTAGFGLVCLGLVSIPLMNLLAIPLCVTAGTLLFCLDQRAAGLR